MQETLLTVTSAFTIDRGDLGRMLLEVSALGLLRQRVRIGSCYRGEVFAVPPASSVLMYARGFRLKQSLVHCLQNNLSPAQKYMMMSWHDLLEGLLQ